MEYNGNEEKEELEHLSKMTMSEKLVYLRELAEYFLVVNTSSVESIKDLCNKILYITKDYKSE